MQAALIVLVLLTSPNGKPIWVVPSQVSAVLPAPDGLCAKGGHTQIAMSGAGLCVREEASEVVRKLEQSK